MSRTRTTLTGATGLVAIAAVLAGTAGAAGAALGAAAPAGCTPGAPGVLALKDNKCLAVTATLSAAPTIGGQATLTFSVTAAAAMQGVTVRAELPPTMRWVTRPQGFAGAAKASKISYAPGQLQVASTTATLRAGENRTYRGVVAAVSSGPAEINVWAATAIAGEDPTQTDRAAVFLTTGAKPSLGIAVDKNGSTAAASGTVRAAGPAPRNAMPNALLNVAKPATQTAAKGKAIAADRTACVKGVWLHRDKDNEDELVPSRAWRVEAWDKDANSGGQRLAVGHTEFDGSYKLCFTNTDGGGAQGQDVFVKWIADSGNWRVQSPENKVYSYNSPVVQDLRNGTTHDYGRRFMAPRAEQRVAYTYEALRQTYTFVANGICWDWYDACRPVVVVWGPDTTNGSFYRRNEDKVYLEADAPDYPHVVIHEAGHSIMDDIFQDNYPSGANCNPHTIKKKSSAGCAWTEGWAEWLPAAVLRDPVWKAQGWSVDLENHSASSAGWDDGDEVEGRVAGALIDLWDSRDDGLDKHWDAAHPILNVVQNHNSRTFAEYWKHRKEENHNVGNSPLAAVFQNSIDYGYDPPKP